MRQNRKIAVTGGIGSGKTLFCDFLKGFGCEVLSCDEIYRQMLREEEYLALLQKNFPDCFVDGVLDKKRLGDRVFACKEDRERLESLAHPIIMQRLLQKMEGKELVFAEVPLLFEGGYEGLFDCVIAIVRKKEARVRAVMERSGLSEDEVLERMDSQFDPALLKEKNCLIVENDGTLSDLMNKAEEIVNQLG